MAVESYKTNLKHFEGPNLENDAFFAKADPESQGRMNRFVKIANQAYAYYRRNGLPPGYEQSIDTYNEILKKNNAGTINFEDLYALDTAVGTTVWDSDVFSQIGIPTSVMSKPRFEIKDYLISSNEFPRFTTQFRSPVFINLGESSQFSNGIGLHLGISIPFTELRESQGALWSPQAMMMQELAAKFGLQKSRRGFLGVSCLNAYGDDGSDAADMGITGLFNYASVQTFEAGAGADDDVTAAADMEYTLRVALTDLKNVKQPGKYVIVSTSGLASEMYIHRDTYQQRLDSERCKEILSVIANLQASNQWGGWYVTEQLYAGAPATANQQMMVMKVGPSLMNRHIVYPTQMLPMANKIYEADIQENMIFGDILQVKKMDTTYNAVPITIAANVTATTTGFIPDGMRIL